MTFSLNRAALDKLVDKVFNEEGRRGARKVKGRAESLARSEGLVITGEYAGSFYIRKTGRREYIVGNSAPHSDYLERGTRPHTIKASGSKLLYNVDGTAPIVRGGRIVAVKSVSHPGNRPYRILQRALERSAI